MSTTGRSTARFETGKKNLNTGAAASVLDFGVQHDVNSEPPHIQPGARHGADGER